MQLITTYIIVSIAALAAIRALFFRKKSDRGCMSCPKGATSCHCHAPLHKDNTYFKTYSSNVNK